MRFKEKASSLILAVILVLGSVLPVGAVSKQTIIGSNRYETAGMIADRMGNYSKAVLVNGNSLPDGLSASSLAGKENAPILLVKKDSIPRETLKRLYGVNKVYLIGKEGAISARVQKSLNQSGIKTERIGGDNRVETSLMVANKVGSYSKAFLVNGMTGEADAMSVASVAARDKAPIILTNGKSTTINKKSGVDYYVIGGGAAMSNTIASKFNAIRLSGSNRYVTNRVVVDEFYPNSDKYYFAKGDSLVDALSVSPLAKNDGVVLVSKGSSNSILQEANTAIQVGGMSSSILNSIFNSNTPKPEEQKPEESKPDEEVQKPEEKPNIPIPGPTPPRPEKTYDINSEEFQNIVRTEFYRLLDAHRAVNGVRKAEHHWACEESAFLKSKHMIDNDYYSHDGYVPAPHLVSASENIHWIYVRGDLTREKGLEIANQLFTDWKKSPGHNRIMLMDDFSVVNNYHTIDGMSFYSKWNPSKNRYDLKATYHNSTSDYVIH